MKVGELRELLLRAHERDDVDRMFERVASSKVDFLDELEPTLGRDFMVHVCPSCLRVFVFLVMEGGWIHRCGCSAWSTLIVVEDEEVMG